MSLSNKELIARLVTAYGSLDSAAKEGYGEGICCSCGYIQEDIEPYAMDYECDECGEDTVCSIENAFIRHT